VIRNAVIHVLNEQPLLADLFERPSPADVGLLCTNLRTMDGRRPVFVDSSDGTFFFPYLHVRFIEIPRSALELPPDSPHALGAAVVAAGRGGSVNGTPAEAVAEPDDGELEIDEDFLRRVREV